MHSKLLLCSPWAAIVEPWAAIVEPWAAIVEPCSIFVVHSVRTCDL